MSGKPTTRLRSVLPPEVVVRGEHTTPGHDGTTLTFEVFVVRSSPDEATAYLNVGTFGDSCKHATDARTRATSTDERSAMRRLASYLRRCADAIDNGAADVLLPSREVPDVG